MALSDLTFKFYTDTGLTTAFSNLYQLTHETNLSDNPQDFTLYFGSAAVSGTRQLQASSSPGVANITLTPTYILDQWVIGTAYSLGDIVEPITPNGFKYKVTTAGTSHASVEPSWPTSVNSTVIDNTIIWTCLAVVHPTTEIKLSLTSGAGLTAATGGAALNIGTTITSGTSNKVPVYIRFTNTNTTVNDNTGFPELGIYINAIEETGV